MGSEGDLVPGVLPSLGPSIAVLDDADSSSTVSGLERGVSSFMIVFSSVFLAVTVVAMALLIQLRNEFDIKARSPYLCMLIGVCGMAGLGIVIAISTNRLFGTELNLYWLAMSYYFFVTAGVCAYGSRVIRLAVAFNPRARQAVPQLMSERNHVIGCVVVSGLTLSIPLYQAYTITGPSRELRFWVATNESQKITHFVYQACLVALFPLVRKVDDIFFIGPELKMLMLMLVIVAVGAEVAGTWGSKAVLIWVNTTNVGMLVAVVTFSMSILDPLRRFLMKETNEVFARAAARRTRVGIGVDSSLASFGNGASIMESDAGGMKSVMLGSEIALDGTELKEEDADTEIEEWTWERVGATPHLATAFEEFARKALCQENVFFLQGVARFHEGVLDGVPVESQFSMFNAIVRQFIMDGAPDEVNISSTDRRKILQAHAGGKGHFSELTTEERGAIFSRAYVDVRYMLEANLMARFVEAQDL